MGKTQIPFWVLCNPKTAFRALQTGTIFRRISVCGFSIFSLAIVSRHWAGASNFPHQGAPYTVSQLTTSTTTVTCTWRPTTFNTNTTQQTASLQSFNSAISISHRAVQRPAAFYPSARQSLVSTGFHPSIVCLIPGLPTPILSVFDSLFIILHVPISHYHIALRLEQQNSSARWPALVSSELQQRH